MTLPLNHAEGQPSTPTTGSCSPCPSPFSSS